MGMATGTILDLTDLTLNAFAARALPQTFLAGFGPFGVLAASDSKARVG